MKWIVYFVVFLLCKLSHAHNLGKLSDITFGEPSDYDLSLDEINELANQEEDAVNEEDSPVTTTSTTEEPEPVIYTTPTEESEQNEEVETRMTTTVQKLEAAETTGSPPQTSAGPPPAITSALQAGAAQSTAGASSGAPMTTSATGTAAPPTAALTEAVSPTSAPAQQNSTADATTTKPPLVDRKSVLKDDDEEEDAKPKSAMQDISFDKFFDRFIPPKKKDDFLDECSKKMNTLGVLCINVRKGSVLLTIGGEKEKVIGAGKFLVANGFSLPAFGDLGKGTLKGPLIPSDLEFPDLPMPGIPLDPTMTTAAATPSTSAAPAETGPVVSSTSASATDSLTSVPGKAETSSAATSGGPDTSAVASGGSDTSAYENAMKAVTTGSPGTTSVTTGGPDTSAVTSGGHDTSAVTSGRVSSPSVAASTSAGSETVAPTNSAPAQTTSTVTSEKGAQTTSNVPVKPKTTLPSFPKVKPKPPWKNRNITMPTISIEFNEWEVLMNQLLRDEPDGRLLGITIPWGHIEWWCTCFIFLFAHVFISYNHYRIYDKTYRYGNYTAFIKILLSIKLTYVLSYTTYILATKNYGGEWWRCVVGFLSYFLAGFLELSGGPYCKVLCDPWSAHCFLLWIPLLNWLAFIWAVAVFAFVQLGLTLIHIGVLWFMSPEGLEMAGLLPR